MKQSEKEMLNHIHSVALDDDHLLVPYRKDQLEMARLVIDKMEKKLLAIADLAQVVLGDC